MTKTGFVIANLFRKKTRTFLTLLSIVMAFLLFGLLQSVNVLLTTGNDFLGDAPARLITQARVSFTQSLPMRMRVVRAATAAIRISGAVPTMVDRL